MSKHKESITDGKGTIYVSGITPNERKRWTHNNLHLLSYLPFIFVKRGEKTYKIPNKYCWEETHF